MTSIWFGWITGIVEALITIRRRFQNPAMKEFNPDLIWMAPLLTATGFGLLGLAFYFMARRWPKQATFGLCVHTMAFVALLSILLMFPIQKIATVLLAAGLAVQSARLIAKNRAGFFRLVERSASWMNPASWRRSRSDPVRKSASVDQLPVLDRRRFMTGATAAMASLALGVNGWDKLIEWQILANLPRNSGTAPNVLLIVLDTVRAQSLSLYGYSRRTTPQLERLSTRGVRFDRALATAPWTLPSHASMFTGYWHHQLSADWVAPLDNARPTLAEILSESGYVTAGFVANLSYCGRAMGLDRGFAHYEDFPTSLGSAVLSTSIGRTVAASDRLRNGVGYQELLNRKTAGDINRDFLRWLSHQDGKRPFLAFLNYFDAHEPYLPPSPFDVMFGPKRQRGRFIHSAFDAVRDKLQLSAKDVQVELDAYEGAISYLDHQIGRLMNDLEERDALRNTLVVITSDHGEEFGEHGAFEHGGTLYLPSIHVPLLLLLPGRANENTEVKQPVTLRDIPATVLDIVGLRGHASFPGHSLSRYWKRDEGASTDGILLSEVNLQGWDPSVRQELKSLVAGKYHYIKHADGQEELYDLEEDYGEERNLADGSHVRSLIGQFRDTLQTAITS